MRDTKALARHYDNLTPEERFRLILAAGARGDKVEQDRLVNSGGLSLFPCRIMRPTHTPTMSWPF